MIVGLTGGIGTGKSTVTNMLRDLGAYVVDADIWARRVVETGSDGLREIVAAFGDGVIGEDGRLDRKALGAVIFADAEARQRLNDIMHPRIRQGMKDETITYWQTHPEEPIVWDVPLLYEGETRHLVNCSILVYAPQHIQLERLMARDGIGRTDALRRISAQMAIESKRSFATYIIENDGGLEKTREQVQQIWTTIRSQAKDAPGSSF